MPSQKTAPSTSMFLRGMPRHIAREISATAGSRGLTLATYVYRLVQLRASVVKRAGEGDVRSENELIRLGIDARTT